MPTRGFEADVGSRTDYRLVGGKVRADTIGRYQRLWPEPDTYVLTQQSNVDKLSGFYGDRVIPFSDYKTAALGTWDRLEKFVPVGPHRETPPRSGLLLVSMLLEAFPSKQLQIFGLELGLPSPGAFWKYHYWSTKGRVAEDQMDYLKEQHPGVLQELECLRELRDGGWVDFVRASNAKIQ